MLYKISHSTCPCKIILHHVLQPFLTSSHTPSARHYNSDLSLWLSVDPMADKYPGVSPYTYCGNNPVRLVDPDGDTLKFAENVSQEFKDKFEQAWTFMKEHGTSGILDKLDESTSVIYIDECNDGKNSYSTTTSTIYWDPTTAFLTEEDICLSPATALNHEADHALESILNPEKQLINGSTPDDQYDNAEDRRVITGSEQETALKHGEIKDNQVTRKNHKVKCLYPVDSPTSTGYPITAPRDQPQNKKNNEN